MGSTNGFSAATNKAPFASLARHGFPDIAAPNEPENGLFQHARTNRARKAVRHCMTRSAQAPGSVVMVRPHQFSPNPATAVDNVFQHDLTKIGSIPTASLAYEEVSNVAERLASHGIRVHLFEDTGSSTPDSVFPNNWFSTHAGGRVAIFPMYAANRRAERRGDIIDMLKSQYVVEDVVDYSELEKDQLFLEGTGAMVLDYVERVAYTTRSCRANEQTLNQFCDEFDFEPVLFDATDEAGRAIYHTNVMMCLGTGFALAGLEAIADPESRADLRLRLERSGREVIDLTQLQLREFAGNAMELKGCKGHFVAMSTRAYQCLEAAQLKALDRYCQTMTFDVPTIELAGGSVRCMLAGIHLTSREQNSTVGPGPLVARRNES